MPTFTTPDGTRLTYHLLGDAGEGAGATPLVCLPGGPMRASSYLGDLGGLAARRPLVRLDLRGTGESDLPRDPSSYRCDRLVDDVEALRRALGAERVDLLGHSAGANLAVRYAERHPERVARLVLVTPSVMAVGVDIAPEDRLAAARLRKGEPWFDVAYGALEGITQGRAAPDAWETIGPFWYGRWDAVAQALQAADAVEKNHDAIPVFAGEGAFAPEATRAALTRFTAPVLVLAGETDVAAPPAAMAEVAGLFPAAELVVQEGASHHPWLDDPAAFTATVERFLA
ncbi:alpha/beta hydrolase [Streptomyces longwoodensis]|uniref:Alpha/beta hydrolase n=1 Tax=Streptomyces longwoodensis TaxID=68231 RepID=A0A101R1K2_9ACTN|nr:alpha/beta hydrolase [Streptomyces longwoodensis]KUN40007.1 alpha/beta hydrolase [Streptomyces longwoodensis]